MADAHCEGWVLSGLCLRCRMGSQWEGRCWYWEDKEESEPPSWNVSSASGPVVPPVQGAAGAAAPLSGVASVSGGRTTSALTCSPASCLPRLV